MKLAQISLSTLAVLFCSAPAMSMTADAVKLEVQAIGSQAKLQTGRNEYAAPQAGVLRTDDGNEAKSVTSPGAGINLTYRLSEILRLGTGLSWVNYDEGIDKPQYQDFAFHGNGTVDLFRADNFNIFGVAGLSYHWVDPKDQKAGLLKIEVDRAELANYDVGLGGEVKLSPNVNLGLTYRYSDSLSKGTMKTTTSASNLAAAGKFKNVTLTQNEVLGSVVFAF